MEQTRLHSMDWFSKLSAADIQYEPDLEIKYDVSLVPKGPGYEASMM